MKDGELIKRHEVKGTPFMIVETKEHGVFVHLGKYRVSKVYRTVAECKKIIKLKPWELLISTMYAVVHDKTEPKDNELKPIKTKKMATIKKGKAAQPEERLLTQIKIDLNMLEIKLWNTKLERMETITFTEEETKRLENQLSDYIIE